LELRIVNLEWRIEDVEENRGCEVKGKNGVVRNPDEMRIASGEIWLVGRQK
jgi:hypothetical protein